MFFLGRPRPPLLPSPGERWRLMVARQMPPSVAFSGTYPAFMIDDWPALPIRLQL